jgi:hypothetical protein
MEPNTPNQPIVDENVNGDSHFIKISVRAWIALILVVATCVMALLSRDIKEPLYSLVTLAVGFYFGQKLK